MCIGYYCVERGADRVMAFARWRAIALAFIALTLCVDGEKTEYNLGVIILDNVSPLQQLKNYLEDLKCAVKLQTNNSLELNVSIANVDKTKYSPKSVLEAICGFEMKLSSVVLVIPDSFSYKHLPIYKYTVNHISSLGIPLIVWNNHLSRSDVYNTVVHIGPQFEQQAQAYMSLLKYYKWYKVSILTTTSPGYIEFSSALKRLVRDEVNEKGEQIMHILSSHTIESSESPNQIRTSLLDLRSFDSRVILLHMTGDQTIEVMKIAKSFNMTGKDYMWMGTTQIYNTSVYQPKQLPPGMIALTYSNTMDSTRSTEPDSEEMKLTRAMLTTANFWRIAITKYHQTKMKDSERPKMMSCSHGYDNKFWKDGKALYNTMIGVKAAKTDICKQSTRILTSPVDIGPDGVNRNTTLNFYNLAFTNPQDDKPREKTWRKIGSWKAPDTIQLDDIEWPGGSPKPPDGKPAQSFLRVVTHSEPPYVKFRDPNPETGKCHSRKAVKVRLTNVTEASCPECRGNKTLFQCATGLCIDLLNKLKEDMQFNYELFQARDNNWGNYMDDGTGKKQWNGLVRELMDGNADISMTSLKIGPERNRVIDFSVPFIETGITIIVLIKTGVISPTAFLEPYQYAVWVFVCSGLSISVGITIFLFEWGSPKGLVVLKKRSRKPEPYDLVSWMVILVGTVHTIGFFILLFDYFSPASIDRYVRNDWKGERFSLVRSLWLIWTILFGAAVETDNTKGLASRFLTATWSLFSLVFLASYTANLAAFMITKEEFFELKGINDYRLRNPQSLSPPFRFGTVPDGSTAINLKKNHPDMFAYMEKFNKKTVAEGIEAVKNNELQAFIYDATVLEYEASQADGCTLTTVGSWYAMTGYGVGFPKGSKWKEKFDEHLTRYINEGEMDRLRNFWMKGACKKPTNGKGKESSHSLDIVNFTSAYILLIVGVVLAIILLLVEHIYFTFCRRRLRKVDECGCCSLLSLSMGESLSFEDTVMEVLESTRNIICQNDFCKANQQRLSHELEVAICRLNMIHATIQRSDKVKDMLPITAEENHGKGKRAAVWSKNARFEDKKSKETQGFRYVTLGSNERLERLESCL